MGMDFTTDGRFLMLNSSGMDMAVVDAETCNKASPKDMKALRYPPPPLVGQVRLPRHGEENISIRFQSTNRL